jgi:DNA invertase Pin-like site-specific DNA recombinase
MIIGYARVSTQNVELKIDAIKQVGCQQSFTEKITGTLKTHPELSACLRTLRKGDTLAV